MMKIAQKCNLQLLPLPGRLCAGDAAGLGGFLLVRASDKSRRLMCGFSAGTALLLVQILHTLLLTNDVVLS